MGLSYEAIREALRGERLPAALVDLDAFDRNIDVHRELIHGRGTPLRPASKSIRVVSLLQRVLERGGDDFRGVLCFTVREAGFLASRGFSDFLVAYPEYGEPDLQLAARLTAEGHRIALTTDSVEGVERIATAAQRAGVRLNVVLCVDMSLKLFGGRVHLGVRRSPIHSPDDVLRVAQVVTKTQSLNLLGLLGYEAQIAGLQDANPFDRWMNGPKSLVKRRSIREVRERRAAIVEHLRRQGIPLTLVNGGGVGSLDSTTPDTGVTEITAGSGFYKPHLFDYYRAPHMARLEPAAFFALEVTRRPTARMVTCLGGGYVASGPPGWDKIPRPWLPAGLVLGADEACGEVQTPLSIPAGLQLSLGDPVIFRHAKGGELMERFHEVLLLQQGRIVDRVPTYRGDGQCFL
jgi:D-serine deaminase-like pyridoxal phosphate-dependent protein